MIFVNGKKIELTVFPDKTSSLKYSPVGKGWSFNIDWLYDGDHECMLVCYLVHHIRSSIPHSVPISLTLPYIPNARMDRVKYKDEIFTMTQLAIIHIQTG